MYYKKKGHNPYFNRWFSAIWVTGRIKQSFKRVTILILIDGFLQWKNKLGMLVHERGHNPYFNRWFSAIRLVNQYRFPLLCHNPYFNRWFSAIGIIKFYTGWPMKVTILILIDGFLQSSSALVDGNVGSVTILILIDGFLQSLIKVFIKICI